MGLNKRRFTKTSVETVDAVMFPDNNSLAELIEFVVWLKDNRIDFEITENSDGGVDFVCMGFKPIQGTWISSDGRDLGEHPPFAGWKEYNPVPRNYIVSENFRG